MTSPNRPMSLAGVFPPIPTPFTSEGRVDEANLLANVKRWNSQPLSGYVVGGSNGEYVLLTTDERVEMVTILRESVSSTRRLIAGSGMEGTAATIDLTRRMARAGADAALVITPSYYKGRMTAPVLEHHFNAVADASPIPVILYNVPANTSIDLPPQAVINLSSHPNIIGMKESGGDVAKIGFLVHETKAEFQVLAGSAGFFLGALSVGAVGCIAALANIAATQLADLLDRFLKGDLSGARAIQLPLIEANTAVTARFGVPGLKAAMDLLGYYGGPVRSPLLPLPEEDRNILQQILMRAGLLQK